MARLNIKVKCNDCGKPDIPVREFKNHLAYEHEIYSSIWYMIKAKTRKVINKALSR